MAWNHRVYLTTLTGTELCEIDIMDSEVSFFLDTYDEFTFSSSQIQNGILQVEDSRFELIAGLYGIKLEIWDGDVVKKTQMFVIVNQLP